MRCEDCKYCKIDYSIWHGVGNQVRCYKIIGNYIPTNGWDGKYKFYKKGKCKYYKRKIFPLTIGWIRYWKSWIIIGFWHLLVKIKVRYWNIKEYFKEDLWKIFVQKKKKKN